MLVLKNKTKKNIGQSLRQKKNKSVTVHQTNHNKPIWGKKYPLLSPQSNYFPVEKPVKVRGEQCSSNSLQIVIQDPEVSEQSLNPQPPSQPSFSDT